jgi:hypothetical protein
MNGSQKTIISRPEAEFLDVIGTKVLRVFLLTVTIARGFYSPPPSQEKVG